MYALGVYRLQDCGTIIENPKRIPVACRIIYYRMDKSIIAIPTVSVADIPTAS